MAQTSKSSSRLKSNSSGTNYPSDENKQHTTKKTVRQSAVTSTASAEKGSTKNALPDTVKSSSRSSTAKNTASSKNTSAKVPSARQSSSAKNIKSAPKDSPQTKHKSETSSVAKSSSYDEQRMQEYHRDSTRLCHQLLPYFFGLLALFLFVCFIMSGSTGWFGGFFRNLFFGLYANAAWTVPFLILNIGFFWRKDVENGTRRFKLCLSIVVLTLISVLLQTIAGDSGTLSPKELFIAGMNREGGGAVGGFVGNLMLRGFGVTGTVIFTVALIVLFGIFVFGMTPKSLWLAMREGLDSLRSQAHDQAEERDIQRETVQIEIDQRKLIQRQAALREREQRLREERQAANRSYRGDIFIDDLVAQSEPENDVAIDTLYEDTATELQSDDGTPPFDVDDNKGDTAADISENQPTDDVDGNVDNGNDNANSFLDQTVFDELMRQQNEKYQRYSNRSDVKPSANNPQIVESDAPPFDTGTTASMYTQTNDTVTDTSVADVATEQQNTDTQTVEPAAKEPVRLSFFRREKVRPLPQTETQKLDAMEREETSIDLAEIFKENDTSKSTVGDTDSVPSVSEPKLSVDDNFLNETAAALDLIVEKTQLGSHPIDEMATVTAKIVENLPNPDTTVDSAVTSEFQPNFTVNSAVSETDTSETVDLSPNPVGTTAVTSENETVKSATEVIETTESETEVAETTESATEVTETTEIDDELPDDDEPPFDLDVTSKAAPVTAKKEPPVYVFPPIPLLSYNPTPPNADMSEEIRQTAAKLVDTLRSFNVKTKIINVSFGPTVTRYELQPEIGTKVRSIVNLVDDIALHLATSGVRIEAPIPGKEAVGIEVPNKTAAIVYIRELIEEEAFKNAASRVTACLGMDVGGNPVYLDVAKMPHLLIAGTTGSGKSVCINSLIISILYKARPDEVKFILIDPKKVELNPYNGIPHLLVPVVSDAKKAAGALHWAVSEMERRYELIEGAGVRNVKGYNQSVANDPDAEKLPQIVIIIDELADLMMMAKDDVEEAICRIAQKARAAGMHLIIGTQRPSVDVITGLIKANVPSRIAFTTMSQVDSRTIIDIAGAEKLIGRGDMLYSPIGALKPIRVQGSFVSDDEVEAVTGFIKQNCGVKEYDQDVMNTIEKEAQLCGKKATVSGDGDVEDNEGDPMLKSAISLAVESGKISTSLIQRRLQLGYGRAAKLIDVMQDMGIVGPPQGQKPRDVLISKQEYMEMELRRSE